MKKTLFLSLLFATTMLSAQKPVELPLWPDGAPNTNGLTGNQEDLEGGRVANVVNPSITVYRPAKPNGMAVIMCPGGGYGRLAMNHEGHDMAAWFTTQGITYAVLKYRMPNGHHEVPLSDAEQAIRLMRGHAKEWGVNPNRIGIMGASAGGHLAASLATLYSSDATRLSGLVLSRHLYAERSHPQRFTQKPPRRNAFRRTGTEVLARTASISPNAANIHHAVGR